MRKSSREDYLEAILIQINNAGYCRVTDLARQIGFTKASTSVALKKLEDNGYIKRGEQSIFLTDSGHEIAVKTYERHKLFMNWLIGLGVDEDTAEADACLMEHAVSDETFDRIRRFLCQDNNTGI